MCGKWGGGKKKKRKGERKETKEAKEEEESRNKTCSEMIRKKSWTKTITEESTVIIIPIDGRKGRKSMCD